MHLSQSLISHTHTLAFSLQLLQVGTASPKRILGWNWSSLKVVQAGRILRHPTNNVKTLMQTSCWLQSGKITHWNCFFIHAPLKVSIVSTVLHAHTAILWSLYRSTGVSCHPQLRTGGFTYHLLGDISHPMLRPVIIRPIEHLNVNKWAGGFFWSKILLPPCRYK